MLKTREIHVPNYQKVIEVTDPEVNLHGFIALHNCSLGPALGGVRIYPYASEEEALTDVLRLAKAMTYKSALCEHGLGGGKSVIIADPKKGKSEALLLAFAEAIDSLEGSYIAAEDIGSTTDDMAILKKRTPYVAALPARSSSGDPSRFTAHGLFRGMEAVAQTLWNSPSLKDKTVAIQGLGHVGSKITDILFWQGANLIVTDIDPKRAQDFATLYSARAIEPDAIYSVECDIFAPCALGGILNSHTIPKFQCQAVAGSANNQLLRPEDGDLLLQHRILYAPDYIINSGGIINAAAEFEPGGYNPKTSLQKVNNIFDILLRTFAQASKENKPTNVIADKLAEYNLANGIGKRAKPINF